MKDVAIDYRLKDDAIAQLPDQVMALLTRLQEIERRQQLCSTGNCKLLDRLLLNLLGRKVPLRLSIQSTANLTNNKMTQKLDWVKRDEFQSIRVSLKLGILEILSYLPLYNNTYYSNFLTFACFLPFSV